MLDSDNPPTGTDSLPFDILSAPWVDVLSSVFDVTRNDPTNGFFLSLDIAHCLVAHRLPTTIKNSIFNGSSPIYCATASSPREIEIKQATDQILVSGQWRISSFSKLAKWFFLRIPGEIVQTNGDHLLVLEAAKVSIGKPVRLIGLPDDVNFSIRVETTVSSERLVPYHDVTRPIFTSSAPAFCAPYSPLVGSLTAAATAGSAAHVFDEFSPLLEFRHGPTQEHQARDDLYMQTVFGRAGSDIEMAKSLNRLVGAEIDADCRNERQITTDIQLSYKASRATMIDACDRMVNALRPLAGIDAVRTGTRVSDAFNSYQTLRAHSDNSVEKFNALYGRKLLARHDETLCPQVSDKGTRT